MQILNILTNLGKAEMAVAEFYYWLSVLFEDDAEASGFFFRMSLQEKSLLSSVRQRCPWRGTWSSTFRPKAWGAGTTSWAES